MFTFNNTGYRTDLHKVEELAFWLFCVGLGVYEICVQCSVVGMLPPHLSVPEVTSAVVLS